MSSFNKRMVIVLGISCWIGMLLAQTSSLNIRPKNNSPYSRFGFGDIASQYYAGAAGMGGLSAAFNDPYHLNVLNPASLSYLQATAFEVGVNARYANLRDNNRSDNLWGGNLSYMALGFPLLNPINRVLDKNDSPWHFGMNLSLQPYTNIGYNIQSDVVQDGELGATTNIFKGSGGTYRLMWGNGVRYKNLAAGASVGYLFGKMLNSRRIEFDSLPNAYSTEFLDDISIRGLVWNAGIQYTFEIGNKERASSRLRRLTIGLYGNSATNFNSNSSRFYQRNNFFGGLVDTLLLETGVRAGGTLPAQVTAGLMYERTNKLKIGAEYSATSWSQYRNEARPEVLLDANRFAFGLEYIPEFNSYNDYFKRVRYRVGAVYASDPRRINGEQLQEYYLSLGLGLPLIMPRQQVSFVNISLEGGRFGAAQAIQENFVRMTFGFTLNDNTWFFKRKFN